LGRLPAIFGKKGIRKIALESEGGNFSNEEWWGDFFTEL